MVDVRILYSIQAAAAVAWLSLGFGFWPNSAAEAQEKTATTTAKTPESPPVYRPPLRGATSIGRIGGGTRGTGERVFTLSVLAPDHAGLTTSAEPTLYWFVSKTISQPVELTVVNRQITEPLLELKLAPPLEPGFHAIPLARHGVRLQPNVSYEWFVALVVDADQRSSDILAGGEILLVNAPDDLLARLRAADEHSRPTVYAQAGYWYDAVETLSTLIGRNPQGPDLRAQRAALLDQVGLSAAAAHDRSATP